VTIAGVTNTSFNGAGFVTSVPSPTQFTIEQAGLDGASGGGTATTAAIGGCITGGVFWDSTAVPADLANAFIFGDFNSGNIMRVRVSGTTPTSVELWGNRMQGMVDMDVGPNGDLYFAGHWGPGIIHRATYQATSQRLVVSKTNVRMLEGGRAAFQVRLAIAPTADVRVSVARASGDPDVSVIEGASLRFGANDWQTPKPVYLLARGDADRSDDTAVLEASATGISAERVTVRVTDEFRETAPPGEGGQGGEQPGGAAGQTGSGNGGAPDAGEGGASTGGGGASDGGQAGESGSGGEPAQGGPADGPSSEGCGCSTPPGPGGGLGWLALVVVLLRRRAGRRSKSIES
jgi:MYXO-CTERM domain-containing protein